jgi:hypothetical protein
MESGRMDGLDAYDPLAPSAAADRLIQSAGRLAQEGARLNAGMTWMQLMIPERRNGVDVIEGQQRQQIYSARLTEVCDLCGIELEWWER